MDQDADAFSRLLSWTVADYQGGGGRSFSARYARLAADVNGAVGAGLWQYFRYHQGRVGPRSQVFDQSGTLWEGINLGSQDYLGLAQHPAVSAGAIAAINQLGPHSCGSAPMGGGTVLARDIEAALAKQIGHSEVLLFPTGWAAGYGAIHGLVRPTDYVIIDALAHNCLQHGAKAATENVVPFIHNSMESLQTRLRRVRARAPDAAILVVTESLFSMDSDSPDFKRLIESCKAFDAQLLLDVAHDFGVLGEGGRGLLADVAKYDDVDYLIGSFSKTFASTGGFFSTNDVPSTRAVQGFSGSYTFSNYLIPPQLGAVKAAIGLVFSTIGDNAREAVLGNARRLAAGLSARGISTLGRSSSMVIVGVGSEGVGRLAYRRLLERGVIVNCIEYPAVRRGEARFRLQLTPGHTAEQVDLVVAEIAASIEGARKLLNV